MAEENAENFNEYVASVLQRSMLTGIPQIVCAKNIPSKAVRLLVFVLCVAGFVYQTLEFMSIYWKFETVLDVRVENPKTTEMPAWTICTNNGIKTKRMCSDPMWNASCCRIRTEAYDWCRCLPHVCKDGEPLDVTIPCALWELTELAFSPYEVYQPFLVPFRELVLNHSSEAALQATGQAKAIYGLDYYKNIRSSSADSERLQACYTAHTLLDRPHLELPPVPSHSREFFIVDALRHEYNLYARNILIYLAAHSPKTVVNPILDGDSLMLGHVNVLHLRKTVKCLLPPPYETNCLDYLTLWKARGGQGPTSERQCIQECMANSSLEVTGCVSTALKAPTNNLLCPVPEGQEAIEALSEDCALRNCGPACLEEIYEATRTSYVMDVGASCEGDSNQYYAAVVVKLDGMQTTEYIYNPKYQAIEVFSYLGGYIGMWLGISLVAVFDFFETLVLLIRYPLHKLTRLRAKKPRIGHAQQPHGDL